MKTGKEVNKVNPHCWSKEQYRKLQKGSTENSRMQDDVILCFTCTSCLNLRSSIQLSVLLHVSLTLQRCAIKKICKLRIAEWNLNSLCHLT